MASTQELRQSAIQSSDSEQSISSTPGHLSATSNSSRESTPAHENTKQTPPLANLSKHRLGTELAGLFSENVIAKIWRVAAREIEKENPPTSYPEYITSTGVYTLREADFWTCGFFPGSIYALLERSMRFPQHLPLSSSLRPTIHTHLLNMGREWSVPIRRMSGRTDTHDMAFIVQPALRTDWELTGNLDSLNCVITAARSLSSRWDGRVGAIRSWDSAVNHRYSFTDMNEDFLVIIDSMCNLDLLYYVGHHTGDATLISMATSHAHTVLRSIVRDDWSTYHLINFSTKSGVVKNKLTNQGYKDTSTWSRGQAWAVLGFTQVYSWTHEPIFLEASVNLAKYFIKRLKTAEGTRPSPFVPLWDFDAPNSNGVVQPRDTSAGMIVVNGLLLLHQILISEHQGKDAEFFLNAAVRITRETVEFGLSEEVAAFDVPEEGLEPDLPVVKEGDVGKHFDGILMHATANNNGDAHKRYSDHGLVYADYYFLEAGNKFIRMGLV